MIAIVGLFFMWVLSNINYRALRLMSESLYIITVVLLILTLLSPEDTNGTYRWCICRAVPPSSRRSCKILAHALDGRYAGPRL